MNDVDPGAVRRWVQKTVPQLGTVARLEPLTGGLLNWVWRARGVEATAIVKVAPPFVATAPELGLSADRVLFEAKALELFGPGGEFEELTGVVRPPHLYGLDPGRHMLVEEDFGPGPDFAARPGHAAALGEFIAALHQQSARRPRLADRFRNDSVQQTRRAVQYDAVAQSLSGLRLEFAGEAGRLAAQLGARLMEPGDCLIMGDLWPRSVLPRKFGLGLIDWEFAHWGRPAQDIGHFGAHLWMYDRTSESDDYREAWQAFSASWPTVEADEETRVHFGCEIIARTVGAFADSYLFAEDRAAATRAAGIAARLIVGELDVHDVWEA